MEKHIRIRHAEAFVAFKESTQTAPVPDQNRGLAPKKGTQLKIASMFASTVKVAMSKEILLNACVELVTVNGRPFSLVADSGFKAIIKPLTSALNITINPDNLRASVIEEAAYVRKTISDEVRGKLISLKVDGATRHDRSVLGVNIQFIKKGKICLRTLAIEEMLEKHTAEYLKNLMLDVISRYEISPCQIYSITTDNGANMVRAVNLMIEGEFTSEEMSDEEEQVGYEETTPSNTELDDALDGIEVDVTAEETSTIMSGVRCAAHTLQLAVDDAIKESKIHGILGKARAAAKKLRTPTIVTVLTQLKLKRAILDCPTRWHSTTDMLIRLLELRPFCSDMERTNKELKLSDREWEKLVEITSSLEPARIATKILQDEQLTMGDLYSTWVKCQFATDKIDTPFAKCLVSQMKNREQKLFENKSFLAALLLDPRFNVILSVEQLAAAKSHLAKTWRQMEKCAPLASPSASTESPSSVAEVIAVTQDEEMDDMDKFLSAREEAGPSRRGTTSFSLPIVRIEPLLDLFAKVPRVNKKENVLEYWESQKFVRPELYSLAQIALACPATQVSVERLFSGLKFILSDLRTKLKSGLLQDIMIVRTNKLFAGKEC